MSYNPYSAVNAIYKLKGQWNNANNAGDTNTKNNVAAKAQQYYKQLRSNGYGDIADELAASNYTQAKAINDKWATMGKTKTRDYLYSLGQSKGMSKSDMDKIIGWDNLTGEVSLGGKKIGTPDAVVDGVSYWADTSKLDNAFNDYVSRSGTVRSKPMAVNQENEKLFEKYNQAYEDLQNTNPFETEIGKAILAKYDLAGLQGRDNAVASGSSTNGGNIDSYAAANAMRQQAALVNQGQMAALEAHQQKLEHARALLSDMGVNIDRVFNQDETAKNNDVARKSEIASVSGYTPDEWIASNNPYMNDDGTLKEEYKDVDFSEVMAKAKATGNTNAYNAAAQARYYKIMSDYGAYGQYDDGNYITPGAQKTEVARQFDEQIAAADRALNAEQANANAQIASNEKLAAMEGQNALDQIEANANAQKGLIEKQAEYSSTQKPSITASQAATAIKNGEKSQSVIDAYNYYYGTNYTVDNPPTMDGSAGGDLLTGGGNNNNNNNNNSQIKGYAFNTQISDKKFDDFKVGYQGKQMYNALRAYATNNGGFLSNDEIIHFMVENSNTYETNKAELTDLLEAMGLSPSLLSNVENVGWAITGGWRKGVKFK